MIPSLHVLNVKPRDLIHRETRGVSQRQMVELQKQAAQLALQVAIRKLIAFDAKLTEDAHDRARDEDYSSFELIFVPTVTELIFDYRTPTERRENHAAMRLKFIMTPSEAMRSFLSTAPRVELRRTLGELCTTVMSEAFSCLGAFNTKMIPLMWNEPDGTVLIVDTVNSYTNDHWANVKDLYERWRRDNSIEKMPKLAGLNPKYAMEPDDLIAFAYELKSV